MKYRKKPVVIEAFQFGHDEIPNWFNEAIKDGRAEYENVPTYYGTIAQLTIKTLEGNHIAHAGDYIIKGIYGELYPCKEDIFKATYEEVQE